MEKPQRAGRKNEPNPVKLIVGLLHPATGTGLFEWTRDALASRFGPLERESEQFPFVYTDYYRDIASDLNRTFFSFAGLRRPDELVSWKHAAISIEAESADGESSGRGRRVNIDPGYLDGARLVLASTKDNAHRIYIAGGIYAEVTLCRRRTGWERFSYTFPDFKSGVYDDFFELVRQDWRRDLHAGAA